MAPIGRHSRFQGPQRKRRRATQDPSKNDPLSGISMFTLSRSALGGHVQTLFTIAEAAFASMIVFGAGLAFGATIGFF